MLRNLCIVVLFSFAAAMASFSQEPQPAPPVLESKPAEADDPVLPDQYLLQVTLLEFRERENESAQDGRRERSIVRKLNATEVKHRLESGVVLSRPQIRGTSGWDARIQIAEAPSQVNYLEKTDDTHFTLKSKKVKDLGIEFKIVAVKAPDSSIDTKVEFKSTMLDGADGGVLNIVGVDVLIGEPIVVQMSQEIAFPAEIGTTYEIALPTPPGKRASVLLTFPAAFGKTAKAPPEK